MSTKTITIRKTAHSLKVDLDWIVLNKKHDDRAKWKAVPHNLKFVVCFGKKSPFKHLHYGALRPSSGPIRKTAAPGRYKYTIEVGDRVLDPGIIIRDIG